MGNYLKLILKLVVSLACFVVAFYLIDLDKLLVLVKQLAISDLLLASGLLIFGHIANGFRFHFAINQLGRRLTLIDAIKTSFVALWFNQLLPTGSGGDVVRGFMLAERCGVLRSVYVTLVDRVLGLVWMLLIVTLLLPLLFADRLNVTTLYLITGLFGAALLAAFLPIVIGKGFCRYFSNRIIYRTCRFVTFFGHMARRVLKPATLPVFVSLLALSFFPYVFAVAVIGNSFGLNIAWLDYVALTPILFIAMNFPISVGGWGVRELTSIYVFAYVGMSEELAVVISMLYGLGLILTSVPGNLVWLNRKIVQSEPSTV